MLELQNYAKHTHKMHYAWLGPANTQKVRYGWLENKQTICSVQGRGTNGNSMQRIRCARLEHEKHEQIIRYGLLELQKYSKIRYTWLGPKTYSNNIPKIEYSWRTFNKYAKHMLCLAGA